MTAPLYLYDRSRVVCDWKCPRQRYWNYEWGGTGVAPQTTALPLFAGITLHDALAAIATEAQAGRDIDGDELAKAVWQQMFTGLTESLDPADVDGFTYAREQATLLEGMVRGFLQHVWPALRAEYPTILFTEQEMSYPHGRDGQLNTYDPTLIFMSKPDLILANDQGEAVYIEYKSTSSKRDSWINSWDTAVQLHSTIRSVKATHGVDVQSVVVQGLYKGYESYGKQSSPFCYAYLLRGNPPFTEDRYYYEYQRGAKKVPVWELPGGSKQWVANMPAHVLTEQFPRTAPIYIKDELVDDFFAQAAAREMAIKVGMESLRNAALAEDPEACATILNVVFPQRFDQCVPSFGSPCSYRKLCHGPRDVDPLEVGFIRRTPHHGPEVEAQASQGVTS